MYDVARRSESAQQRRVRLAKALLHDWHMGWDLPDFPAGEGPVCYVRCCTIYRAAGWRGLAYQDDAALLVGRTWHEGDHVGTITVHMLLEEATHDRARTYVVYEEHGHRRHKPLDRFLRDYTGHGCW